MASSSGCQPQLSAVHDATTPDRATAGATERAENLPENKLPTDDVMTQLVLEQRLTAPQIGALYGVTRQAVRKRIEKMGLTQAAGAIRPRISAANDLLPWVVPARWDRELPLQYLRLLNKRLQNHPLSDAENRRLDKWCEYMSGRNQAGIPLVVDFSSDTGFRYVAEEPGDTNCIRRPSPDHPDLRS